MKDSIGRMSLPLAAAAACVLFACEPGLPGGTSYILARAGDEPLPVTLRDTGACRAVLYGGEVAMDGKGGFTSTYDIRRVCGDSIEAGKDPGTAGRFTVRNDTAYFYDQQGIATGKGLITADSLVVRSILHRLVYLRAE